jgi:hypothetical protein
MYMNVLSKDFNKANFLTNILYNHDYSKILYVKLAI